LALGPSSARNNLSEALLSTADGASYCSFISLAYGEAGRNQGDSYEFWHLPCFKSPNIGKLTGINFVSNRLSDIPGILNLAPLRPFREKGRGDDLNEDAPDALFLTPLQFDDDKTPGQAG
jgi:hypothetical protein